MREPRRWTIWVCPECGNFKERAMNTVFGNPTCQHVAARSSFMCEAVQVVEASALDEAEAWANNPEHPNFEAGWYAGRSRALSAVGDRPGGKGPRYEHHGNASLDVTIRNGPRVEVLGTGLTTEQAVEAVCAFLPVVASAPALPDAREPWCSRCGARLNEKCPEDGPGLKVNTRMCPRKRVVRGDS